MDKAIVFALLVVLFSGLSIVVPGFIANSTLPTLLQKVAVLAVLGLSMALIVIGRDVDLSRVASWAVPSRTLLPMVQDGHGVPASLGFAIQSQWRPECERIEEVAAPRCAKE